MPDFNPLADLGDSLKRAGKCRDHPALRRSTSVEDAQTWHDIIALCSPNAQHEHLRWFALHDLFFLLVYILNRKHLVGQAPGQKDWPQRYKDRVARWSFERCAEVQTDPDGHLDIWPRESGKCLDVETLITLADGTRTAAKNIEVGTFLPSVGSDGTPCVAEVLGVLRTGRKVVRKFTTAGGRQFVITDEHRMLGPHGAWATGAQLSEGGWVGIPSRIDREIRQTMSIDEAAYLGFMMSDGAITQKKAIFTNEDLPVICRFQSVASACGFTSEHRPAQRYVAVRGALGFQRRMGVQGHKATEKQIPQELFHQPDDRLWAFLSAFIDCDGYVSDGDTCNGVVIALANQGLVDGLRHIFDLLGIYSTISGKRENDHAGSWAVAVYEQKALRRLAAYLMLSHPRKIQRLRDSAWREIRHDRSDPIPHGWERLLGCGVHARQFRNVGVKYPHPTPTWVSRSKVERFANLAQAVALIAYLKSSVRWEKIESVSEPFETDTLDIQTTTGTFHANGVISHNSEIITFGKTVQDILADPNETIGFFSHTRPMAKQFLRIIATEFTTNEKLKALFPDVLWRNPKTESPKWSEDDGLLVKRKSNRKEMTIEAWGLVDGQPTSKRFTKMIFDDVVSRDKVSDDMIMKTTSEFENALLLTASDPPCYRYIATYQEPGDTTEQIEQRGILKVRKRGPFDENGFCAYMSDEKFQLMRERLSPKVFALQILLDPVKAQTEEHVGFETDWLHFYREPPPLTSMNVYLLVDPAGKSKESNSRFAMWAVGLLPPKNIVLLDAVLDKLDLSQRAAAVIGMHRKFYNAGKPPLKVGYESYGMQGDIEYLRERMAREGYIFTVIQLSGTGQSKDQRIELLIPDFRAGNILIPEAGIPYKMIGGEEIDIAKIFCDQEYKLWPFRTKAKDLLDALARVKDPVMGLVWPRIYGSAGTTTGDPWSNGATSGGSGWMAS